MAVKEGESESMRILKQDIGGKEGLLKKLATDFNAGIPGSVLDIKMRHKL